MDQLKEINQMLLKESEIAILKKYKIDVLKCRSLDEILFFIDEIIDDLTDEEYEELDYVAGNLMERKYYGKMPK